MFYSLFGVFALVIAIVSLPRARHLSYRSALAICLAGMLAELFASLAPFLDSFVPGDSVTLCGCAVGAFGSIACYLAWGSLLCQLPLKQSLAYVLIAHVLNFILFPWIYMLFPLVPTLSLSVLPVCGAASFIIAVRRATDNGCRPLVGAVTEDPGKDDDVISGAKRIGTRSSYIRFLVAFAIYSFVLTLRAPLGVMDSTQEFAVNLLFNGFAAVITILFYYKIIILNHSASFERTIQVLLAVFAASFFISPYVPDSIASVPPTMLLVATALLFMTAWIVTVAIAKYSALHPFAVIGIWGACYGCPRLLNYALSMVVPLSVQDAQNSVAVAMLALFGLFLSIFLVSFRSKEPPVLLQDLPEHTPAPEEPVENDAAWQEIAQTHSLTERESQVLRYALEGHSRRYIADQLLISENTVKAHLKKIYAKMDVHSKYDLERILSER